MTTTHHTPGLDFEEWLTLRDRITRMRRLGRAAARNGKYLNAWEYYQTAKRAKKRLEELEKEA